MSRIEKEYLEHVYYEMKYYFWTYDNLNTKICNELHNVILESHIVHLRVLADFLTAKGSDEGNLYCTHFDIKPIDIKIYNKVNSPLINKSIFHIDRQRYTNKNIKYKQSIFVKDIYCEVCKSIKVFLENLSGDYLNYEPNLRIWLIDKATEAITNVNEDSSVFKNITFATYEYPNAIKNSMYQSTPEVSINSGDVQSDNLGPGSDMSDYYVWKSHSDETDNK
jgi:hypothetical protein